MTEDLAPFHGPQVREAMAARFRAIGIAAREAGAALVAATATLRQAPMWAPADSNSGEPFHVGCGCLCAVEHEGLGVCVSVAVPTLKVMSDSGVNRDMVAVCRPCFQARGGR